MLEAHPDADGDLLAVLLHAQAVEDGLTVDGVVLASVTENLTDIAKRPRGPARGGCR